MNPLTKTSDSDNLDNKSDMALSNKKVKDATEQFDKKWSQIITVF